MKRRKCASFALAVLVLLTACGAKETAVTTEEVAVPEMSSKDILVNSLEYLLEDKDGEEKADGERTQTEQSEEEDFKTRRNGDGAQEKEAVICYGRDLKTGLVQETVTAEEITPDVLLNALARHNIVPLLDTKALSLEEKEEAGQKLLYLDLSRSFREYLTTMSMEAECIIISSIANTFLANYDADAVYITVEGETLTTSNAEYAEAVPGCTPEEMLTYLTSADEKEDTAGQEDS